jgi:hypothetical protein
MDAQYGAGALMRSGGNMRTLAVAVLALVFASAPAWAWEEYVYADQGFAIQFPQRPKIEKSTYESQRYGRLPATVYSVEDEHIQYKMTVAELGNRVDEGANLLGEQAYWLMRDGDVIFNDVPRVDQAQDGIFGVTMVLDLKDGRRQRTSIYVHRGRFYRVDAIVLPARGDKDMAIPSRFDQTLRFALGR